MSFKCNFNWNESLHTSLFPGNVPLNSCSSKTIQNKLSAFSADGTKTGFSCGHWLATEPKLNAVFPPTKILLDMLSKLYTFSDQIGQWKKKNKKKTEGGKSPVSNPIRQGFT